MKLLQKATFVSVLLLLLVLSNGQYAVFFAIWLAIPMLLFAVRKLNRKRGFLFAFLALAIANYFSFDVVPFLPMVASIAISAIFAVFASLPYLIDSFFSKKRASFWSTLIFPTAVVIVEYVYHTVLNQYGNWGHFAYSQESQHILLQSASVFGMGYITFLISWFASVTNWIYEQRNNLPQVKTGVVTYGLVLGLTLMYGGYRVTLQKADSETVRIASISAPDSLQPFIDVEGINNPELVDDATAASRANATRVNQYLFDKSIAEAQAGAKIVFWAEGNGAVLKADESALYAQAAAVAAELDIYLGLGVAVIDPSEAQYVENKLVVFDPNGEQVINYWKENPVPGAEASISNVKRTGIQHVETEYGTLAGVICFDMDFPEFLRGASGADMLLAPSNDWIDIDPMHTDMAKFRAIEQGFNMVRQTSRGLSAGIDYTGKVISHMDHFTDRDKVMTSQLPTQGVRTIYSLIGDSFIAFCLVLFGLAVVALKDWKTVRLPDPSPALSPSQTA